MGNILRYAIQQKRNYLIHELIKSGVYKKNDRHLYEWTLSDLEEEYKFIETNTEGLNTRTGRENNISL